jgi:hypothetical protein
MIYDVSMTKDLKEIIRNKRNLKMEQTKGEEEVTRAPSGAADGEKMEGEVEEGGGGGGGRTCPWRRLRLRPPVEDDDRMTDESEEEEVARAPSSSAEEDEEGDEDADSAWPAGEGHSATLVGSRCFIYGGVDDRFLSLPPLPACALQS